MSNLTKILKKNFDASYHQQLILAGDLADSMNSQVYLVGGAVRDVLLGKPVNDIDLVVVGDSEDFAGQLAIKLGGEITARSQFLTAKISFSDFSIDVASARRDYYPYPGSLPQVNLVKSIDQDLVRRDISINAMAISINRNTWGDLIDPMNGEDDLYQRKVRILYKRSFRDDPTRMLRVVLYSQRLGFPIDENTKDLIPKNLRYLRRMAGWRIFITFKHILRESDPHKILNEAHSLGILRSIHSSLELENVDLDKLKLITKFDGENSHFVMLSILVSSLAELDSKKLIRRLKMTGRWIRVINDTQSLKKLVKVMSAEDLLNSKIFDLLSNLDVASLEAMYLISDSDLVRSNIRLFLDKLRFLAPELNGDDLIKLGFPEGPHIGNVLKNLENLVIDGIVKTREDEVNFARGTLTDL